MLELARDLKASIRGLLRRPGYPIVGVGILALGLSAGIAVVTYVNAFFQPFPGVDADDLVRVFGAVADDAYQDVSYLDFLDYAAEEIEFFPVSKLVNRPSNDVPQCVVPIELE